MRKLLNKPWVVAVIAVVAVFLVFSSLRDGPRSRAYSPTEYTLETDGLEGETAGGPQAGTLAEALRLVEIPAQVPDPFASRQPRAAAMEAEPVKEPDVVDIVRLSAIWSQGDEIFVVLNARIHRPGETIGRLTIETVQSDGIWLTHWKGRDFVRLGTEFTLTTSAEQAAQLGTADHEG